MYEHQSEPIQQLPLHQDAVRVFEGCSHEFSHPTFQSKKDEQSLWMGKYLKPGRLSQTRTMYFCPEGASSTICPAQINTNLSDVSDGPMKDEHSVTLSERESEVTEALCREAAALQSHLVWVTDLLMLLAQKLEQPGAAACPKSWTTKSGSRNSLLTTLQ